MTALEGARCLRWMHCPAWVRALVLLFCATLAIVSAWAYLQPPARASAMLVAPPVEAGMATAVPTNNANAVPLPALTTGQLNRDMHGLLAANLTVNNSQSFELDAQGSMPLLVAFLERLSLSSHELERYSLKLADGYLQGPVHLNLATSAGRFLGGDHGGFEQLQHWLQRNAARQDISQSPHEAKSNGCQRPAPLDLAIDAVWSAQGYAVVREASRTKRIHLGDFLQSGWQLQAFEQQDLVFYWPGNNGHCPQTHRLKVVN